jgi:hypothetical protein
MNDADDDVTSIDFADPDISPPVSDPIVQGDTNEPTEPYFTVSHPIQDDSFALPFKPPFTPISEELDFSDLGRFGMPEGVNLLPVQDTNISIDGLVGVHTDQDLDAESGNIDENSDELPLI